jgi:hypothetical protein
VDTAASDGAADGADVAGDACGADDPTGDVLVDAGGVAPSLGLIGTPVAEHAMTVGASKRSAMARESGDRMGQVSTACHERGSPISAGAWRPCW